MATKKSAAQRKTHPTAAHAGTISLGEWLITMIVLAIPLVGLIMLFVWAFGGGSNPSKRNFCRAALILMAVSIVLGLIFTLVTQSLFSGLSSYFNIMDNFF